MTSQHSKTIFITGSSSGLGRAAAKLFASRGWNVLATMRSPDKEKDLATLPNVVLLPLDITDPHQITRAVNDALARGDVDVVFNNAGYGMAGPLEGVTDEQMLRMVQHQPDGADPRHEGVHPSLQSETGGAVHQHHVHRRPHHGPVQLDVPRDEMGARGLEREHGVRTEPVRHRHEDHRAGRHEDRFLHAFVRCRPPPGLRRAAWLA